MLPNPNSACTIPPLSKTPSTSRPRPTAPISDASRPRWRAIHEGGSSAPSRSAAIGGTRVARKAGPIAASMATSVPTNSGSRTVSGFRVIAEVGSPDPALSNSVSSSFAKPMPDHDPGQRRQQADHQRLDQHRAQHLAAAGADRAQQGELAGALGDRDRERVEDDEGAANTVAPANASSSGVRKSLIPLATWLACSLAALGAGLHLHVVGHGRDDALLQLLLADARVGLDRDRGGLIDAVIPLLGVREGGADDGGAADRRRAAEVEDAHDRDRLEADRGCQLDVLADLQMLVVCQLRVDHDLTRRRGRVAGGERVGVEGVGQARDDQAGRAAAGAGVLAVHDQGAGRLDLPLGLGDAVDVCDRADQRRRQRPGLGAVVVGEGGALGGQHVGLLETGLEDAGERARDLVADDEGARDHGRAQDDRDRRQDGAGLAAPQAAQGDQDHWSDTSAMAVSTSCSLARPWSRTIRPSARNRMRSAIADARASWVTITVVCP